MKSHLLIRIFLVAMTSLLVSSCFETLEERMGGNRLPEGTPIMMRLDFSADDLMTLNVSTKAEATPADEERIHDLYVLIFDNADSGNKIYGRYFSYEHLKSSLATLDSSPNEGWWVENRTIDGSVNKTNGAVKISTKVCSSAKLVVIANIDNGICKLGNQSGFPEDVLDYLNGIRSLSELEATQVKLTQDVVNRKDLFLMLGMPEDGNGNSINVNTETMIWGTTATGYDSQSSVVVSVKLRAVDAKVKFKIRINDPNNPEPYISAVKAVYWEVDNVPDRCFLFSDANGGSAPEGTVYFDSEQAYFEGTEDDIWYVFSFYMLESRFAEKNHAATYHEREKQNKIVTDIDGYTVKEGESYYQYNHGYYVENGEWTNALPHAPYVKFDMILTLTPEGVQALGGNVNHALTSDTIYTVHLGDFCKNEANKFDDYNTLRSTYYTYEITIANSGSIYAEVKLDHENQPGQEGYLLLTDDEIVNADCHYEYHSITFTYDPQTSPEKFSWYVKTPFTSKVGGGPVKGTKTVLGKDYPTYDPHDTDGTLLDYRWVKFAINEEDNVRGYKTQRVAYPGDDAYNDHKDWGVGAHGPWDGTPHPELMDISQLIQYIFQETDKERDTGISDFKTDTQTAEKIIRATIFIDEYYYEVDPRDESANPQPDPQLWRQFVNAQPRELHILSKTVQSRDRKSDVIESSHSVIQQSIQTIYNVFEPDLESIWGCEHVDEIKQKEPAGAGDWPYWPYDNTDDFRAGADNALGRENGRLNSAYIWGVYSNRAADGHWVSGLQWNNFLNYTVDNKVPELRNDNISDEYGATHYYHGMAWSCLTRNRDNDGDGEIDPEEIRWYMASSQQLAGIWVGSESLSTSARLYQPAEGQWRAHVVSSTNRLVSWAEEGGGATSITQDWIADKTPFTWNGEEAATVGESVRCVRNIGTYDDTGTIKDISFAPVTHAPDKYFTLERHSGLAVSDFGKKNPTEDDLATEASDYFIFHFDRLNTKSIREYSPGELPYHDQNSLNNRVYAKMITQSLNQDVSHNKFKVGEENMTDEEREASSDYVLWKDINNNVTKAGNNKYCPPGYRFPNHTEWLLMSLYLPDAYLKNGVNRVSYTNTPTGNKNNPTVMPSRTYYDRGYYGALRSETADWKNDRNKVGWIFSDKMHNSPYDLKITHSRCVKDDDQTGVISGKIALEGSVIYPGDTIPFDFKFSSTASTFTDATLTLWYTKNGFRTPYDLTSQLKTPTGLQYKGTQEITIPTLTELGLTNPSDITGFDDAGINMSIEVEFTNLNGCTGGHELDVKMKNPLSATLTVPDNHFYPNDSQGGTIQYDFSSAARNVNLGSVSITLSYTDQNDQPHVADITGGLTVSGKNSSGVKILEIPSLSDLELNTLGFNLNRTMTLSATVTGTNGMSITKSSNVTLVSHLDGTSVSFPTDYDTTDGIPVDITIESVNDRATVSSASFYWKTAGGSYSNDYSLSGSGTSSMSTNAYVKDIIGGPVTAGSKYYFYIEANCSDGTSIRSDVWSMEVLYYGKCWNEAPDGGWTDAYSKSDITAPWPKQTISNLDFAAGDFIDAYIDVTHCNYVYKDGSSGNDLGMDNIITLGVPYLSRPSDELNWKRNGNAEVYIYYPAHNPLGPGNNPLPSGDYLQIAVHDLNKTVTRVRPYTLSGTLTLRLEENQLLINNGVPDWSQNCNGNNSAGDNSSARSEAAISAMTSSNELKIGSIEGAHRSRATYNYVRVIRKETSEP